MMSTAERNRVRIVSLLTDVCSLDEAASRVESLFGRGGYVVCANVHMTMEAVDDPAFADLVNSADLVVPDGKPLFIMQKKFGAKADAEQIRGYDLMTELMLRAASSQTKIGFFGSSDETLERLRTRAENEFSGIDIAYIHSPPRLEGDLAAGAEIISAINDSGVDILFVALGCPKQEKWMARNREMLKPVQIGVGAAVDFYAGTAAEAPKFLQKIGLEWLYRLSKEPRRLWRRYLMNNPRFIYLAAKQLFGKRH
jgi:N-acetylglucosaminyldiphosphoundecaprenol N-acetyl-beta-D-mannosaminyltransferase